MFNGPTPFHTLAQPLRLGWLFQRTNPSKVTHSFLNIFLKWWIFVVSLSATWKWKPACESESAIAISSLSFSNSHLRLHNIQLQNLRGLVWISLADFFCQHCHYFLKALFTQVCACHHIQARDKSKPQFWIKKMKQMRQIKATILNKKDETNMNKKVLLLIPSLQGGTGNFMN